MPERPEPEGEHVAEAARLKALETYHLVDTPPSADFDRLAALAARLFDVPIALVSLVTADRQFFKARVGLDVCETPREISFCAHALQHREGIFVIPDALKDERFRHNPVVLGAPFVRFYAGHPLVAPGGEKLGTICLIDVKPRDDFGPAERHLLSDLAALVMDRMELHRLDYAKSISQARFENIAATSPDAIVCSDANGAITFWNSAAEKLFGYTPEEIAQLPSSVIVPFSWKAVHAEELLRLRTGQKMEFANQTVTTTAKRKDGSEFPAEISFSTWQEGRTTGIGAIIRDITERRQSEDRLYRLATRDPLTDLPNRGAWRECLTKALKKEKQLTVLLLDLDGFKEINDTFGHSAGDAVLKQLAARLDALFDQTIMLGRLGGDEFVVLLPGAENRAAIAAAEALIASLSAPYDYLGHLIEVGVSVGVALGPQHGSVPEDLLGAADLALYKAKAAGKGRYELFTPAIREVAVARRTFERELKSAFEAGQFEMHYQPQVYTANRRVLGAEALIRWNHPVRGMLTPASFIDVLGGKPSAAKVGEWILQRACQDAAPWRAAIPGFRISVNLFEAQFHAGTLLTTVQDVLASTGTPAAALELEIVENIVVRNDSATLALLHGLRDAGVGLAFDDYGTGYASLSLLKRYPVSRLKIDKSFMRDVLTDREDAAVVRAIVYLGQSFGMEVIAEGIETDDQLGFLIENACRQAQGFLFGAPMPAPVFSQWLARQPG
ncbi:putative bifunctional diguanylate cyclase/phosphodiesterase [Achromobacter piechaudii]|uniref:Uncharacterized protein n=1 Tax=Achromobacter piechaudii TaxID=72556 RepID=A0ABM8L3B2_9BURK|nr:EAL domain-containing protein [Achromobacter piechaudii]CAB3731421.1 hypothetical protein LMG1873_04818 [Achromobacter piechaudii]CAB3954630.1 hypothetical protein LMG6103_04132 [Achromobacter piechaudii]